MAWDVRQTYYYLVCFATLMMVIIGGVQIVRNGLDLAFPEVVHQVTPMEMQRQLGGPRLNDPAAADTALYTREELRRMAEEEKLRRKERWQRRNLRDLLGNLALLLIAVPVYWYHWRRVRTG